VIVWDKGIYETLEPLPTKRAEEKLLLAQLKSGSLKVRLHGKKLKGEFALVHIKNNNNDKGDNAWLLIKHRDEFASDGDITKKDKSVVSGKSITQLGKDKNADQWISDKKKKKPAAAKKKTERL
jgi:bifunctional non-homologous end joining protein LigD